MQNPGFPGEIAGSNDSEPEIFIKSEGSDNALDLDFKYLLPLGAGRHQTDFDVVLRNGLVVGGGRDPKTWNPLTSGLTTFKLRPFYRSQDTESDFGDSELTTAFLSLSLEHDNTDFRLNPSRGSIQRLAITRDWGFGEGSNAWTQWDAEYSKFFSLGATDRHRQRVLAFDAWLSDVPTWQWETVGATTTVDHRPPYFEGSTLGGFNRLRAFPSYRFHDRSAMYYSLEYRAIPEWNIFDALTWLPVDVHWWQWVVYGEVGRVADDLDLNELHQDMKWDLGFGIRTFSEGVVGRVGIAFSREDWSILALFGHPF